MYNLEIITDFTNQIKSKMDQCDNGEGLYCSNLEDACEHYSSLCKEFTQKIREWLQLIFSGQIQFDQKAEKIWLDVGHDLSRHASQLHEIAKEDQLICYVIEGKENLFNNLTELNSILGNWIRPQLSVSPSPRMAVHLTDEQIKDAKQILSTLPPLQKDWEPSESFHKKIFGRFIKNNLM